MRLLNLKHTIGEYNMVIREDECMEIFTWKYNSLKFAEYEYHCKEIVLIEFL